MGEVWWNDFQIGRDSLFWCWNTKVSTDFAREKIVDLAMAGDAGRSVRCGVEVDGMAASLTQKLAAMVLQMANQVAPLHANLNVDYNELTFRIG